MDFNVAAMEKFLAWLLHKPDRAVNVYPFKRLTDRW